MIILFGLVGAALLLFGLKEVWHGRWRPLWIALSYSALFVLVCLNAEIWFRWFGMNRGDGQIFIGFIIVGGFAFVAAIGALILAPLVALFGRRRAKQLMKD